MTESDMFFNHNNLLNCVIVLNINYYSEGHLWFLQSNANCIKQIYAGNGFEPLTLILKFSVLARRRKNEFPDDSEVVLIILCNTWLMSLACASVR